MSTMDDHYKALGRIIVKFQSSELCLSWLTQSLIGPDHVIAQIITSQLPFSKLCSIAEALFRHKVGSSEQNDKLALLLKWASSLEQQRNAVMHSVYSVDEGDNSIVTRMKFGVKRGQSLQVHQEVVTVEKLNEIADSFEELNKSFMNFMKECKEKGFIDVIILD